MASATKSGKTGKKKTKAVARKAAKKPKAAATGNKRGRPAKAAATKAGPGRPRSRPKQGAKTKARGGRKNGPADRSAPQLAEVDADVLEFIAAIDKFKKKHGRPFPSWSEVLLVVKDLGYKRT